MYSLSELGAACTYVLRHSLSRLQGSTMGGDIGSVTNYSQFMKKKMYYWPLNKTIKNLSLFLSLSVKL